MVKVLDRDRDDSIGNNGVAVQISGSAGGQQTRIAIALQKDAPPSNYIPMEPQVLVAKLSRRFEHAADREHIATLNKRIGLRCALRTEDSFSDADHVYSIFDPDADSVSVDQHCGLRTKKNLTTLQGDLETLLDMAGFQPVPQDHIRISQRASGLRGFNVKHPPPEALKIQMYYQRLSPVIIKRPHWLFPWQTQPVQVMQYGNLVACFQQMPAPPQLSWTTKLLQSLRRSAPVPCQQAATPPDDDPRPQAFKHAHQEPPQPPLHLRVFRSVDLHNADMLVPGAVARFTLFDKLLIWVPILIGVGSALYKIATSSLTFNPREDPVAFATTLALVLMPLSYAVQVRFSLQQKADNYKADIDELLLMRQRSSNAGALQWLLDMASEQEQKEMLLAYAFLWGGAAVPAPVARDVVKRDVDAAIEQFLHDDILRAEGSDDQAVAVDFDMTDALGDIVREGLVHEIGGGDMMQAVPLPAAVAAMSIRNYPEQAADASRVLRAYPPVEAAGGTQCPNIAFRGSAVGGGGPEDDGQARVGMARKSTLPPLM